MDHSDGFFPIVAVFYAVFHPTEGTKIVYQVPENSIKTKTSNKYKNADKGKQSVDNSDEFIEDNDTSHLEGDHDDFDVGGENDSTKGLFNFDTVKNYIIPKSQLCNKLISVQIGKYKVMGYPVNIENTDYSRNSFNFNFCFVFDCNSDTTPYESAIERMGKMFRVLEEQLFVLSKLDKEYIYFKNRSMISPLTSTGTSPGVSTPNGNEVGVEYFFNPEGNLDHLSTPGHKKTKNISLSSIESLINQIYQDLNTYSECCIPIDLANSVDIKLFPIFPPPVNIKAQHVPIATVKLNLLVDSTWDPTMVKILPYIDGINSIKRISELADADYILTKQCIQHFMHYECLEILDIFQFTNIYAPTNFIGKFLKLLGMAEECQAYVVADSSNSLSKLPLTSFNGYSSLKSNSVPRRDTNDTHPALNGIKSTSMTLNSTQAPLLRKVSASYALESPSKSFMHSARGPSLGAGSNIKMENGSKKATISVPSKTTLFYLYRSLNQQLTLRDWYFHHQKLLVNVDIRRFINFGVSRGIIYRVHSYPILNSIIKSIENDGDDSIEALIHQVQHVKRVSFTSPERIRKEIKDQIIQERNDSGTTNIHNNRSLGQGSSTHFGDHESAYNSVDHTLDYSDWSEVVTEESDSEDSWIESSDGEGYDHESSRKEQEMIDLLKLVKGFQPYDSVCSHLHKSRAEVREMLEALGASSEINA
ncbi:Nitrogen permease regulator 2 [Scheffersomyces spartinae]|uniref:Nitrogen permease regulator 2 n=1 Tax=Scheffersomyces spartinae TaxID=45513 RepID=A0A9P8AHQ5_9ASCO|nr:Nitrogen permease regulator 2 [Scheffersomyces spartinae]KAG7193017.1 Nitrogen permease regulator 2 [Scheffersomyces spartinae]